MGKTPSAFREIWNRKPVLQEIYADIYRRILATCVPGPILEIGGGSGNFKAFAPHAVSSDIVQAPWLNLVCDAQRLPFAEASFANIVMVDVLHHLESPALFFAESMRVLKAGGRLIFCEPAITPLSSIFYRLFHEEPFNMHVDPLANKKLSNDRNPWEANQGIPSLIIGRYRDAVAKAFPNLTLVSTNYLSFLAYPLSGGFKPWTRLPAAAARPLLAVEWRLRSLLGRLAAFRLLAAYEKRA